MVTYTSRIDLLKELQTAVNDGSEFFESLTNFQIDYSLSDKECLKLAKAYLFLTLPDD